MKVPFTQNQQQSSYSNSSKHSNLLNLSSSNSINTPSFLQGYEPKSVLELRQSPDQKPASNNSDNISGVWDDNTTTTLQLEDHVLINQLEDFDFEPWMRELGLHEDSTPTSKPNNTTTSTNIIGTFSQFDSQTQFQIGNTNNSLPDFPPAHSFDSSTQFVPPEFPLADIPAYPTLTTNSTSFDQISPDIQPNWNLGFDYVDELIRLAECFETNSLHLTHVLLGRLNHRLRSPSGKPLQRAAFYFKEALQTLLTGSTRPTRSSTSSEVIQTIKAHKSFSNISPIPMFSSFTANQAVLEALDSSALIHVIDFDIGLGGHWASFLKELADKADSRKMGAPVLRLTAVVTEEYAMESKLIRENLLQFARELNIGFTIDFVLMRTFEFLSFKSIKFMEDEKIAILLSPAIFRRVGTGFLNDLRRVSPHVVVHLDCEGLTGFGTTTFRQTLIDGLEFYSTLLESLEAANGGSGSEDWMKKIETFVIYPKILEVVGVAGRRGTPWREAFAAAGLRPVALSQFADFQAECLIGRIQVRGFHVARRQAEMLLCWHERPLVATSAWRY
ncbi:OLC1v1010802C1 [Oldenlandia corymbosa var. corymbosa]|uniref:OLC1v1010802C1 n=1 Tax=Oldenlandia corymbosa var. corymbosa TaxID=529605 RepID=A0AAV1DVL5_OLDCO|nr:OLC1v1010802C1 [Oldenlandia corymbosa var. corymbosa]